jgi:hypothetical protein
MLLNLASAVCALGCVGLLGITLARAGYLTRASTTVAGTNSCQELIERAMQASASYCEQVGPNKVCYGNITLKAELAPNTIQRFSERGDVIDITQLRRLSAAPLDLDTREWGIAIFKMLANMPRSLPGEMVTMVVFGNTILDNNPQSLESFYFSSELGKIVCEGVPVDGIMVDMPDGAGISLKVNGTELILMGNAGLQAVRNGDMQVSLYSGSGRIVSQGQEQYFGAGQQISVKLGGSNGMEAVSPPSVPKSFSSADFRLVCRLTGQNCSPDEITPVSQEVAQVVVQSGLDLQPGHSNSSGSTLSDTHIPKTTDASKPTKISKPTKTSAPTDTPKPTKTAKITDTPKPTNTPKHTPKPTDEPKPTKTPQPTDGPKPIKTPKPTDPPAPTHTPKPTDEPKPTKEPKPTDEPKPTKEPKPTDEPKPTKTPKSNLTPADSTALMAMSRPSSISMPVALLPPGSWRL